MPMRRTGWLGVVVLALVCVVPAAATAAAPAGGGVTAQELVYEGAQVEMQIDVNGEAAVQLVGGAIDALAATAQEQAKVMAEMAAKGGEGPHAKIAAMAPAALQVIEPVKEAIKSLTQMTVVVMRPKAAATADQVTSHYSKLMGPRGWSPLMSVRGPKNETVMAMLAREGKGLFFVVREQEELVTALVTTSKPLGDLIAQIIRASGAAVPAVLMQSRMVGMSGPAAPPAPPKAPPK